MDGLLIIGAGGHGKVVASIAHRLGRWGRIAFLDDKFGELTQVEDWPVLGTVQDAGRFLGEFSDAFAAFGDNALRLGVLRNLLELGFRAPVLIHPDASVSRHTVIGAGTVLCAQSAVIVDARIGVGAIVNTAASVGHDCTIGDGVHVAPGVRLAGGVVVGESSWVGLGAVVKEQVVIGKNVMVGAGSVVLRNLPDGVTAVGVPARVIQGAAPVEERVRLVSPNFTGFLEPSDPRWPEVLRKVPHDFFHLPGYMATCAPHEGGVPVLGVVDAGDHGMALPLIRRPLSQFGEAFETHSDVSSPYGYPGPLHWDERRPSRYKELHGLFEDFLRRERIVSLFVRLNAFVGVSDKLLAPLGEVRPHGPTVYLDLRNPALSWECIDESNRRFIQKGIRKGWTVTIDRWDTLDEVIAAYYETMERLETSSFYFFPKHYFVSLRETTGPAFHLATCLSPEGEVTGGTFFSEVGGLIQYFLTGSFTRFKDASPSKLMVNALRLWGLEHGHQALHLGGGLGAERDGLFEFKARLSKSFTTFHTYRKVLLEDVYADLAAIRGFRDPRDPFFPIYRKP